MLGQVYTKKEFEVFRDAVTKNGDDFEELIDLVSSGPTKKWKAITETDAKNIANNIASKWPDANPNYFEDHQKAMTELNNQLSEAQKNLDKARQNIKKTLEYDGKKLDLDDLTKRTDDLQKQFDEQFEVVTKKVKDKNVCLKKRLGICVKHQYNEVKSLKDKSPVYLINDDGSKTILEVDGKQLDVDEMQKIHDDRILTHKMRCADTFGGCKVAGLN